MAAPQSLPGTSWQSVRVTYAGLEAVWGEGRNHRRDAGATVLAPPPKNLPSSSGYLYGRVSNPPRQPHPASTIPAYPTKESPGMTS